MMMRSSATSRGLFRQQRRRQRKHIGGLVVQQACSRIWAASSSTAVIPGAGEEILHPFALRPLNSLRFYYDRRKVHNNGIIITLPFYIERRGLTSLASHNFSLRSAYKNSLFGLHCVRWKSDERTTTITKDENGNDKVVSTKGSSETSAPKETRIQERASSSPIEKSSAETTARKDEESSSTNKLASGAAAATQQLQERIVGVVNDLNLGDQLAVILIAVFTAILLTAPYAVRHMKKANSNDYDERMPTDDVVDEFAKLARSEWGLVDSSVDEANTDDDGSKKNIVDLLLKDVFKSQALQHAAQEFVVQIIQSERFKEAVSRLVKELWNDLVTDPETVAQVVKLLEIAIQNPQVKMAAQDLVLHVFVQEAAVREALIGMVEKLGEDDLVRQAVIRLLTDAAHTTLNDPELLDHSMEFATDVVGDDIVQQTAGDALRKSIGHAVRPATTVLLTAAGVGFLIFSVVAIGYSRSSEQEVVLFESAARSLRSNVTFGIFRIITWPLRQLQIGVCKASAAFWALLGPSFAGFQESMGEMAGETYLAVRELALQVLVLPWLGIKSGTHWLLATVSAVINASMERLHARQGSLSAASITASVSSAVVSAVAALWSASVSCCQQIGKASASGVSQISACIAEVWTRLLCLMQQLRRRNTG